MQSSLIISDSGGIQEEAPTLKKKRIVVTKNVSERSEGVAGFYW
jgi:UDP-N-acetylglucosamine 2-epimerase (non-hydrolysing)